MKTNELIEKVMLAVNPKFQYWTLFSNGTYIIVEKNEDVKNIEEYSLKHISEYGPVHVGSPAGDFSVIDLTETEGWCVTGHGYGMYTYVHPSEIEVKEDKNLEIGMLGRGKRQKDSEDKKIIYVNREMIDINKKKKPFWKFWK